MSAQPSVSALPAHPDDAIPPELRPFCKRGLAQYRKVLRYVHERVSRRSRAETRAFLEAVNLPADADAPARLDTILAYAPKRRCGACGDWYLETAPGRSGGHCSDGCRRRYPQPGDARRADACRVCGGPVGRRRRMYCGEACAREGNRRVKEVWWRAVHPGGVRPARPPVASPAPAGEVAACAVCGDPVAGRKSTAVYCSRPCKDRMKRRRLLADRPAPPVEARRSCLVCGGAVPSPRRMFCGAACYRRDDNRRRNERRAAAREGSAAR